ncbi:MAG: hypothetical protein IR164_13350 [Devosia sp.]|uniref:hypothetical protein n=1 Tax=Devosia sp. TaxID=1871048 RepID=UPI0019E07455|nr:hypothetical protein [Devosia sp.]MBF0679912.1 hypothetical protein [Devosia sp.]
MDSIPTDFQWLGGAAFAIAIAVLAAWSKVFGNKEGPATPKVQEFSVSGQLADMGPVKELIEQTGLLMQQQVRTNIHLEAVAVALKRFADEVERRLAKARER